MQVIHFFGQPGLCNFGQTFSLVKILTWILFALLLKQMDFKCTVGFRSAGDTPVLFVWRWTALVCKFVYPVFAYQVIFRNPFHLQGCVRRLGHFQCLCVWLVCCLDMSCCVSAFQSTFPLRRVLVSPMPSQPSFEIWCTMKSEVQSSLNLSSLSPVGKVSCYLLIFACWALCRGTCWSFVVD